MKRIAIFSLAAIVCAALLAPMSAPAYSQTFDPANFGPIHIDSVSIGRDGVATRGITVVYHNTRPEAASKIVFRVNYRGVIRQVVDVGTFSQYAEINHTFDEYNGFGFEGQHPDSCVVVLVRFADGSVWRR